MLSRVSNEAGKGAVCLARHERLAGALVARTNHKARRSIAAEGTSARVPFLSLSFKRSGEPEDIQYTNGGFIEIPVI